jgi:hypothetical protein
MNVDPELEPFARLIDALDPWLDQVVIIGGWAHRLYRLDPRAQKLAYAPLTTLDSDIAVPSKIEAKETNIRERLLAAGFREEFIGEDCPPATHYHLGAQKGFYAEFLTPLVGAAYDRSGKRKATREVGGISSQQIRYIDVLLLLPWRVSLDNAGGYPFEPGKRVQIANPVAYLAQKILNHRDRDPDDRAKDVLYIHDTIETFAGSLAELREVFAKEIGRDLHANQRNAVRGAADALFGSVNDTVRKAVLIAKGRGLVAQALIETCRAGLKAIFV